MDDTEPIGGRARLRHRSSRSQMGHNIWTLDKQHLQLSRAPGSINDEEEALNLMRTQMMPIRKPRINLDTKTMQRWRLATSLQIVALQMILVTTSILVGAMASPADDFFPALPRPLRFTSDPTTGTGSSPGDQPIAGGTTAASSTSNRGATNSSSFVWQPLPLRATFRPLNRQSQPAQPPPPPRPPRPPTPPSPPEPLALISERSISDSATGDNLFGTSASSNSGRGFSNGVPTSFADDFFTPTTRGASADSSAPASNFFQPPLPPPPPLPVTTTPPPPPPVTTSSNFVSINEPAPVTSTPRPLIELDEDQPTRQPSNRFRPTKAPSDDADTTQSPSNAQQFPPPTTTTTSLGSTNSTTANNDKRMSSECFECICEASTNCNTNSRCQTSDVRHTRCGMFLISYDQWLTTGLSRELVTREALARDAAADERAFYECVTTRECSERLLAIFMARNQKDCDRDGRVDCYDYAAIHHSGLEQCASESLLDSQYWNDFNACLGFGR